MHNADPHSSRAVRYWSWWISDRGRRWLLLLTWAFMTSTAFGYVGFYARNLPTLDEWVFVPVYFGETQRQIPWLIERHHEHRFPLPRALYLSVFHAFGSDFRAGCWTNVALLSLASLCWISAARSLRGESSYADCLFPILFLHRAHGENFLMGYQVVFTLPMLSIGIYTLAVANCYRWSFPRTASLALIGAMTCCLSGGVGITFALFQLGWLSIMMIKNRQYKIRFILPTLSLIIVTIFIIIDMANHRLNQLPVSVEMFLRVLGQIAEIGMGEGLSDPKTTFGWVIFAFSAFTGLFLAWNIRCQDSWGLLSCWLGATAFLVAIALARPTGYACRFSLFSATTPAVIILVLARFFPKTRWGFWSTAAITFVLSGLIIRENWKTGNWFATYHTEEYARASRDVEVGVPLNFVAERQINFWSKDFDHYWRVLNSSQYNPNIFFQADVQYRLLPTRLSEPIASPNALPGALSFQIITPIDNHLLGIRLLTQQEQLVHREPIQFRWVTINLFGQEVSHVEILKPWLLPETGTVILWVNGRVKEVWVDRLRPESIVTFTGAELLLRTP